jgi:hypothetical protein
MSNKDEQSFQAFFNTSSLAVWNLWLSKLFQFFLLCQLTEFDNVSMPSSILVVWNLRVSKPFSEFRSYALST